MLENHRTIRIKSKKGLTKFLKYYQIRSGYLYPARGAKRILARLYGGIGSPRRMKEMVHLKMRKRFGIGLNKL